MTLRTRRLLLAVATRISGSRLLLWLERLADLRLVQRRADVGRSGFTVVVTTLGSNIGDQAMLDACLQNISGRVVVVVPDLSGFRFDNEELMGTRVEVMPGLVSGWPWARRGTARRFASLLAGSRAVAVIGADVMDGSYSRREAVLRFDLLRAAATAGVRAKVLGFSWSAHHDRHALRAALRAAAAGVELIARDRISAERLDQLGVSTTRGADVVFSRSGRQRYEPFVAWRSGATRDFVVVNRSGLSARSKPETDDEYVEIERFLERLKYDIVLLPHVIRSGDNDLDVLREVRLEGTNVKVLRVEELLSPSQVAEICSQATLVLTGRMHLGILALSEATPAIVLASHGKVEGMLQEFGLADLAVEPEDGFGSEVVRLMCDTLNDIDAVRANVYERLESVKSLSAVNWAGFVNDHQTGDGTVK